MIFAVSLLASDEGPLAEDWEPLEPVRPNVVSHAREGLNVGQEGLEVGGGVKNIRNL